MYKIEAWTVGELLEREYPETESILGNNLIDRKGAILVTGPQKIGKSLFGSQLALSLADRQPFLGFATGAHSYRTLILQAEVAEKRMRERFDKQAEGFGDAAKAGVIGASVFSQIQLDAPDGVASVVDAVKRYQPDVVIVDPLACFHGGDESDSRDMGKVMNGLNDIRAAGPAVILTHHHGKASRRQSNIGYKARGSSVIPAWYDSHFSLEWADQQARTVKLDFELRNGEAPESKVLKLDPVTLQFKTVDEETGGVGLVLSAVRHLGPSDSETVAEHHGKSRQWANIWLNRAADQEKLIRRGVRPVVFYLPDQLEDLETPTVGLPEAA